MIYILFIKRFLLFRSASNIEKVRFQSENNKL